MEISERECLASLAEVGECPIYDSFDENVKKYIKQIWYIDDTDIKYFKIFSLYCMEYDPSTNFFLKAKS